MFTEIKRYTEEEYLAAKLELEKKRLQLTRLNRQAEALLAEVRREECRVHDMRRSVLEEPTES